jgi:hypothetical protein
MMKYVLDMRFVVVDELPEKNTLVPKHVGFGTQYELSLIICFIVF